MPVLHLLEGIRTPLLDQVFLMITEAGYETVFLIIALFMLWCVDKHRGYFMLSIGFIGLEINQVLKMIFKIPRPWVLDPKFTIVEKARAGAGGYSFPSGHTQIAADTYGAIAVTSKKWFVRILCILLIAAVAFSRMYLGVHTPKDVCVSLLIGILLLAGGLPVYNYIQKHRWAFLPIMVLLALIAYGTIFFVKGLDPASVDADNLADAFKTVYTMAGAVAGLIITWLFDTLFIHYEVKGTIKGQLVKLIFGFAIVMAIRIVLKAILGLFMSDPYLADAIRYFVMVFFAGVLWPLTFNKLNRL